jgi:hypothetical protein
MGVDFNQMPNALQQECLGIETQGITWTTRPLG